MRNWIRLIPYITLGAWLLIRPLAAPAIEVRGLYEAELPVTSQGRAERSEVIRAALTEVVIKVSGNSRVALSPGIPELLGRSNQFLQQYRYRTKTLPPDPETGELQTEQYLWVRFDQVSLDRALRDIQVPVWGRSRPLTLAWLVVEQQGTRQVLGSSEDSEYTDAVLRIANRRGIPLDLPLYDLEDQGRIRASDIIGGFQNVILAASQRYSPDAVLIGRLRDLGNDRWESRWTLNLAGRDYHWSEQGGFDEVIGFGIDGTATTLASRFVTVPDSSPGQLAVLVLDVFNLDDYARSDEFLAGLDGVVEVQPGRIDKDRILYRLRVRGNRDSVVQAVRLSSRRVLEPAQLPSPPLPPVAPTQPVQPVQPAQPPAPQATAPDIVFRLLP